MIKFSKKAVTLVEIMFAVGFLALSFLPIIGVFASNMKVTTRDQTNIVAMKLCQEKLDNALSLPFQCFPAEEGAPYILENNLFTYKKPDGSEVSLDLRNKTIDGVLYQYKMIVEDRVGSFSFYPVTVSTSQVTDPDDDMPSEEGMYTFSEEKQVISYKNLVHRYTMKVYWTMKGGNTNLNRGYIDKKRSYTLVTLKADLGANI